MRTDLKQELFEQSSNLQVLEQANLVATRREGTKIYYRLAGRDELLRRARAGEVVVLAERGRRASLLADGMLEWRRADLPVAN